MFKILLADDEKTIRAGIKKIILTNIKEEVSILEARNGEEAYTLCMSEFPDLLITDIRMPGTDGVMLMEKISAATKKPYMIVLSGYDDFSYAKAAITSGALAYVLKPVDREEFISAVNKGIQLVKESRKKMNESLMQEIANNSDTNPLSFPREQFPNGLYCLAIYGKNSRETLNRITGSSPCFFLSENSLCRFFIIPCEALEKITGSDELANMYTGISPLYSAPEAQSNLKKIKAQAQEALLSCYFPQKHTGIFKFKAEASADIFADIEANWEKCISFVELHDFESVLKSIKTLFEFSGIEEDEKPAKLLYLYEKILESLFRRYLSISQNDAYLHTKEVMIERLFRSASVEEWKSFVTDYVIYLAAIFNKQNGGTPFVTKALEYMEKNFTNPDITMATVSNYVSANYTWFSEKFKEQTGSSFNEYLKKLRINKAKELLELGIYKVYEVSQKCGYRDSKHFIKSFHATTGLKPSEWAQLKSN
ncbi:MAG: response regulator [Treponema sp.]|nr:response regulator [Treponema sp.]